MINKSANFAQILVRGVVKLLLTGQTAEVIGLPLVLRGSGAGAGLYIHAANRILHRRFTFHHRLPFFLSRLPPVHRDCTRVPLFLLQAGIQTFPEAPRICQALFLRADRAPGREV